jgi:hypothetical protein
MLSCGDGAASEISPGGSNSTFLRLDYPYRWKCTQGIPTRPTTVGERIKRRRLLLHLFQTELAKMFGVDETSIRNWEHNTYQPSERFIRGFVEWLGYDPRKAVAV